MLVQADRAKQVIAKVNKRIISPFSDNNYIVKRRMSPMTV
jgi:hypothetical protein